MMTRLGRRGLLALMVLMVLLPGLVAGQEKPRFHAPLGGAEHEYSPLRGASFELENLRLSTIEGEERRLGELIGDRKLVLIHYFATFCHNSNYDVETINRIHREYGAKGVAVIGICEYSRPELVKDFIEKHGLEYPILIEGRGRREDRERTSHYRYRKQVGDTREWGTPLTIVIDGEDLLTGGETLARRMSVATGELIGEEFRKLAARKMAAAGEGDKPEKMRE